MKLITKKYEKFKIFDVFFFLYPLKTKYSTFPLVFHFHWLFKFSNISIIFFCVYYTVKPTFTFAVLISKLPHSNWLFQECP